MSGSNPDRRGLRWTFIGLGVILVLAPAVIADHVLNARWWAASLSPGDERGQLAAVVALRLCVWATGLLCLATAWGLKRGRGWARWTGVGSSLLLLAGFPWLTVAGGILLYFLWARPPEARKTDGADDYWSDEHRESLMQVFVTGFIMLWVLIGLTWLGVFFGLPRTRMGWDFWLTVFVGELVVATVHESGHSLAAWAVGYRFLAIRIGPVTVWKDHGNRHRIQFEWRRILLGGGSAGAVPTSEKNVRRNEILVTFAGPFACYIGGMLLLLVVAQLPGSAWEEHWQRIGLVSLLFLGVGFLGSLVPAGRSDGLVLWHLIFRTERGKELIAQLLDTHEYAAVEVLPPRREVESELERRRREVKQALESSAQNPEQLGFAYRELGRAQEEAGCWQEAEASFRKSIEYFALYGANPLGEGFAWAALQRVYHAQQRVSEVYQACASGLAALERARENRQRRVESWALHGAAAALQAGAGNFDLALWEIDEALATCPDSLGRAALYDLRATCEFRSDRAAAGLEAAGEAERLIHRELTGGYHMRALSLLAELGAALRNAGQDERGTALLEEAIAELEKRGATERVAMLRLTLAEWLRRAGRMAEAEAALPNEAGLNPGQRRGLLYQRAHIQLKTGRVEEAITGFQDALRAAKEDPNALPMAVPAAESSLAEAYLEAGRLEEAEELTRQALHVLKPAGHPDAASALVTLALIAWRRKQDSAKACLDEAVQVILAAPLLKPSSKARFFEETARSLERAGQAPEAKELREAAAAQWRTLGVEMAAS